MGQPVSATLTAFPGERFAGRIIAILPSAQEASRTITVRAAMPNPGLRLKPGMFAQVMIAPERREALLIPSEAVIRTGERTLVMISQQGGGYRPAEVRIGREAGGRTEVLAGLAEGEEVVTVFRSSEWAERAFCGTCGSNLWYRFLPTGNRSFLAGLFDAAADLPVEKEIFSDEAAAWTALAGDQIRQTGAEVIAEAEAAGFTFD